MNLLREVTEVMPVVDRVLSEKEMVAVGQHGIEQFDKKFLMGYLGMMMATNPLEDRKAFFKEIPAPVRLAYRLVGRRMFGDNIRRSFPGAKSRRRFSRFVSTPGSHAAVSLMTV
ncbi:hypothetical protein GD627_09555 [Arthrobacter yangruifuii]|uniref:Uncharacterized protein n=1 Tax=Arthrobacter yangruifuii TaxID=2606616 RepID=A0A5N6MJW6_9MICC|nr:hypothetical protein GD627_09555 [Arthrobacter yangruifuii]